MRLTVVLGALLAAAMGVSARSPRHVGRTDSTYRDVRERIMERNYAAMPQRRAPAAASPPQYLNNQTQKFHVNGAAIPEVDFNIGESYAGLLPISSMKNEPRQLYFWFFPSQNPKATDEILIWLNGGPGCSSLEGLLQENGPFLWQYGTLKPVPNPWTWVNLTNVVWVDQPVGTGFSQGTAEAKSEADVAHEFMGFWKNFVDTFSLHGRKVYITGESYAGMYVPHIASAMLDTKNTTYYGVEGTMIYDPSINQPAITNVVPAPAFVEYWAPLFALNDSAMQHIRERDRECGLTAYLNEWLTFPPKGKFAEPPQTCGADLYYDFIQNAAMAVNPCWDFYEISTTCPLLYDVLGYPGNFPYEPPGGQIYFNRADVKAAINAPQHAQWSECGEGYVYNTTSGSSTDVVNNLYSSVTVLPGVIERSKRTIIGHGMLDYILLQNGTLLSIQNMTWNGAQGFQSPPTDPFYVPPHTDYQQMTLAASGIMGITHTERGLTYVQTNLCGHMEPQYQPSASYRHLEVLLGRIPSLSSQLPFTTSNDGLVGQLGPPSQQQ